MGHLLSAAAAEQNILDAWQRTLDRSHAEHIPAPEVERFRSELLRNLAAISTALRTMEWTPPSRQAELMRGAEWYIFRGDKIAEIRAYYINRHLPYRRTCPRRVLTRAVDHRLQPDSYAFRPGLGIVDAREALRARIDAGNRWVVRTDIADYLDGLDQELWTNGADIVRYADDIACAADTPQRAHDHLEWIRTVAGRRTLQLNQAKTAVHDRRFVPAAPSSSSPPHSTLP
nr:hypothetical protein [uncultured Rhodococcus sp.]